MKFLKGISGLSVALAVIVGSSGIVSAAVNFGDVPSSNWAYNYVSYVVGAGIMTGDISGNFNPNAYIDKFETSRILAQIAGYKTTGASSEEQSYYTDCYNKNYSILAQFEKAFAKWDSTADKEISFLLEKQILTVSDLNQFVIKRTDGSEALRALTREETAVFVTKAMGKGDVATSGNYSASFNDDSEITVGNKPYVYYLKGQGVFTADGSGNFNPKTAVTRSVMAVILTKSLGLDNKSNTNGGSGTGTNTTSGGSSQTVVQTVSGSIDVVYQSLNTIQIKDTSTGASNIYVIAPNATITVDGYIKTSNDLSAGMDLIGVVTDGKNLVDIKAQSATTNTTVNPKDNTTTSTLTGTVMGISNDLVNKTVDIQSSYTNSLGQNVTQTNTYALSSTCPIKLNGRNISFLNIQKGDMVNASVSGSTAYVLEVQDKDQAISGTLTSKFTQKGTNTPILVVKKDDGTTLNLVVQNTSTITRKGDGSVGWDAVKIGDSITAEIEYNNILSLTAYGKNSSYNGVVKVLHFEDGNSYITIKDDKTGELRKYATTLDISNIDKVKLGCDVEIYLDSSEITSIDINSQPAVKTYSGYVYSSSSKTITLVDAIGSTSTRKYITIDSNTKYIDSTTGKVVTINSIKNDMQVFVVMKNDSSGTAGTVTILAY